MALPSFPSRPHPLGVHLRPSGEEPGVDVAVLASHADAVDFCVLDGDGEGWVEHRFPLPERTHGVWHGFVPGVTAGTRYGFRVHGRWEPSRGIRCNPAKLLLDPYARAVLPPTPGPELYGHTVDATLRGNLDVRDDRDSLSSAAHGIVVAPGYDWQGDAPLGIPWRDTVVYEAHVRGLTRLLPGVPEHLRGTYAGLAHPAALEHLTGLGVTTVELLPVQAIADEPALVSRGMPNYWGYSTLGFFAPHAGYAADRDPVRAVREFRDMVRALHGAGLEVVLDVVYNHTCEGGVDGPSLSWRGLDGPVYYRLDGHGRDVDTTGCGNSLDFSSARVVQFALDSLRYWVQEMHVDGFRFDLAVTLGRGREGFDPDHPFLVALRADPVLAGTKLIAEPWDLGPQGWRTGQFPPPFTEWNDRYRDGVREFWLAGAGRAARGEATGGVRDLATRLAGSADLFPATRGPLASINFVTAHDGFTIADLTAYDVKHNEANGEHNRDGTDNNRSWNHGVEGPTGDDEIAAARRRTMRNLLGTLLLSAGVPMLVAGDEFGRTQHGNNNAYCQDGPVSWVDWELADWQRDLLATTRHLLRLRREYPALGQDAFFAGRPVHEDGTKDLAWFAPDGSEMDHARWHDPALRTLSMFLHGAPMERGHETPGADARPSLLLVVQGHPGPVDVTLPGTPWARRYRLLWDSCAEVPPHEDGRTKRPGTTIRVPGHSMRLYGI